MRLPGGGTGGVGYLLKDRGADPTEFKTIEAAMANILSKLDLEPDPDNKRRVLAVLAYLDSNRDSPSSDRAK